MNPELPGHITHATYLTVMFVSLLHITLFLTTLTSVIIPCKFISNFRGVDTILEISVIYRKLLCTLYEVKINQCI